MLCGKVMECLMCGLKLNVVCGYNVYCEEE